MFASNLKVFNRTVRQSCKPIECTAFSPGGVKRQQ